MPTDLTPAELDAIEERQVRCYIDVMVSPEEDAYALLSALRAAWEERDRLREVLRNIAEDGDALGGWQCAISARAALTPPGTTGEGET